MIIPLGIKYDVISFTLFIVIVYFVASEVGSAGDTVMQSC
jgi:hypothetical protein